MEYKVLIAGVEYTNKDIKSASIESPLFDVLSVGNACSATLEMEFWPKKEIPPMAEIVPYVRKNPGDEWVCLGRFFIDERSTHYEEEMQIIAYDSMLKAEAIFNPSSWAYFPMPMLSAAEMIAEEIGVSVDQRTELTQGNSYAVQYPTEDVTLRDILRYIAAANMGNWIITANNQLLFVPLFDTLPVETNYLVDEQGNAITFGGVRILV